eukprot:TRINITY_DN33577_c0_g1_i1.p1 TRINITY_DN33577_c0_g1~~TRINITY_DN33577_c0_g1_i1.p1  ORF type:complete len:483 (+),score=57.12 TRINITY_DN33577_c0_g1_i1:137-1585(+)
MYQRSPLKSCARTELGLNEAEWYPKGEKHHSDRDVFKVNLETVGRVEDEGQSTMLRLLRDNIGVAEKVLMHSEYEEDIGADICTEPMGDGTSTPRTPRDQIEPSPLTGGYRTPQHRFGTPGTGNMGLTDSPRSPPIGTPPPPQRAHTQKIQQKSPVPTTATRVLDAPDLRSANNQLLEYANKDLLVPLEATLYLRNSSTGIVTELTDMPAPISAVGYSNLSRPCAVVAHSGHITVVDILYPEDSRDRDYKTQIFNFTCLNIYLNMVSCGTDTGFVRFYDVRSGAGLQGGCLHNGAAVTCVKWSPDGHAVASCDVTGVVKVTDMRMRRQLMGGALEGATFHDLSWSAQSGGRLAVAHDNGCTIYNTLQGGGYGKVAHYIQTATPAHAVNWDSDHLITSHGEPPPTNPTPHPYTINIYSGSSFLQTATLTGHHGTIHQLAVSPDHQQIASGSADETIRLWELGREKSKKKPLFRGTIEELGMVR